MKQLLRAIYVFIFSAAFSASALDIQVTTSKPTYYLGERIEIYTSVLDFAVIRFPSSVQGGYVMDQTYVFPDGGGGIITFADTPRTWTNVHSWSGLTLTSGVHSVVGTVAGQGASAPQPFSIVPPPTVLTNFLIGFETVPTTDALAAHASAFVGCGAHFHTISNRSCSLDTYDLTNSYITGFDPYPTGFNVAVNFDRPVFGASARVRSAVGVTVTMTARGAAGQVLASATQTVTSLTFNNPISLSTAQPIASLEWRPSLANASMDVDDLFIITTPPLSPTLVNATTLRLSWQTNPGETYQLWTSADLKTWSPCGAACLGTGGILSSNYSLANAPAQFFRVTKQ